jgi:hypothetical protein
MSPCESILHDCSAVYVLTRSHLAYASESASHTERDTHVLPAAEVLRGKLIEMTRSLVDAFDRKEDSFQVTRSNLQWLRTVTLGTLRVGLAERPSMPPTTAASTSSLAASPCLRSCYVQSKYLPDTQEPSRTPPASGSHNSSKTQEREGSTAACLP